MSARSEAPVTFNEVGGLQTQIQAVKEMMLFPILYKDVHQKFNLKAPRGVLFHGPPGTGKTLLASALAAECSIGDRPITFISHKGADILGCYVGESESRLREVFERARRCSPSIIFFDEIDALAPSRNNLSRGNHVHASVVSVLLTEMDGIGSAKEVFVIGATNRLDAIDPALRRPGRFDRELRFSLPTCEERKQILKVHTSRWKPPISDELLSQLAMEMQGHCGADLRAICSEALMCCLRRTHPKVVSCVQKKHVHKSLLQVNVDDFTCARAKHIPAAYRSLVPSAKCLSRMIEPLFKDTLNSIVAGLETKFPYGYLHGKKYPQHSDCMKRQRLLLTGSSENLHTSYLAPAILHHFEHLPVVTLDIATLFSESDQSPENACAAVITRARMDMPCVLHLPDVTRWWSKVEDITKSIFLFHINGIPTGTPIFLLMTSNEVFTNMPSELQKLFVENRDVVNITVPSQEQRQNFFRLLLFDEYLPNNVKKGPPSLLSTSTTSTTSSGSAGDCLQLRDRTIKRPAPENMGPASKRKKTSPSSDCALMENPADPSDQWRRNLLQRLVAATAGFAQQPLERIYEDLSACYDLWVSHQSCDQLKADLHDCVAAVEQEVSNSS